MARDSDEGHRHLSTFPTGAFIVIVCVVCLGLAASAGFAYIQLREFRINFLKDSASRIAGAIDGLARGPDRSNPATWERLFAENAKSEEDSVAFLALLDESGEVLAGEGERFASLYKSPPGFTGAPGVGIYVYEAALPVARGSMMGRGRGPGMGPGFGQGRGLVGGPGMGPGMRSGTGSGAGPGAVPGAAAARRAVPARLKVGIYSSAADFIRWQAYTHLAINGIAIATLIALALYFLHTLRRFLLLKQREESARHLASLGAMAATLAHEIRNPLGAMKGLTQLAQEDLPRDHKTQSMMNTVVQEAERLERLVTDLLTFARPQEPEIQRFGFLDLVRDVRAELLPKLEASGIRLETEAGPGPLWIDSDPSCIRQILLNVLLNASDSTPPGGSITVRIRHEAKERTLIAEIDDAGPGIGQRDAEDLFQPFATTKIKGTGLGLPISRRIAERLGGRLTLANRAEGGARCTLTLPADPPLKGEDQP